MGASDVEAELTRLRGYIAESEGNQRVVVAVAALLALLAVAIGLWDRPWIVYVRAALGSASGFVLVLGLYIIKSHLAEWRERLETLTRRR